MITIGEISKAQGVKGEVKINAFTDDVSRFEDLKSVTIQGKVYAVEYAKVLCNGVFIKFANVNDRNEAERLVGRKLEIAREDAVKLGENEFFIVDVVGSEVCLDGERIGKIVDILQYGAADVWVVGLENGKRAMFPFLNDAVNKVDTDSKLVDLKRSRFEEIAVYED